MRYFVVLLGAAVLVSGGYVVITGWESEQDRVEGQIEARLGPTTEVECAGEDDHWLCDLFDHAIQRDYSGCLVRLDGSGRIISRVERCRPQ